MSTRKILHQITKPLFLIKPCYYRDFEDKTIIPIKQTNGLKCAYQNDICNFDCLYNCYNLELTIKRKQY